VVSLLEITADSIAARIQGRVEGSGDVIIRTVGRAEDAVEGEIVLAENDRYFNIAAASQASCILTGNRIALSAPDKCTIRVDDPGSAFVDVLQLFQSEQILPAPGISPSAEVSPDATIGDRAAISANCFIGKGSRLGKGCVLFPNVYIGEGVVIADDCRLYPGVTIYPNCTIGSGVVLHAGVVIGSDGFGYRPGKGGLVKLPHIGTVEIGDFVEIGANSAVDRAKVGATIIGSGTKIDNLVHIAHNVHIGRCCVIAALSGVAGSVDVGDGVTLAAQIGVKDHVRIEDGAIVAARAGVIGDVKKGAVVSGFPARDHTIQKRAQAAFLHLPDLLERVRSLEREIERLRTRTEG
jgi:UDP-3-O-[3-hydroxymyristoyl] glucosamine N-acyltransferase